MLGVDPGSRCTGLGVVRAQGARLACLDQRVITPREGTREARLAAIFREMQTILARFAPTLVAMEDGFVGRNARAALALGEARGVVLAACAAAGVPVARFSPAEIKLALVGHGQAGKEQVQFMVRALLGLREAPPPDAADALAAAICAIHHRTVEHPA